MTKNNNHIDNLFRDKLGRHEFKYHPSYWMKMKSLLNKVTPDSISSGASKIAGLTKWKLISVVAIISTVTMTVFIFNVGHKEQNAQNLSNQSFENQIIVPDSTTISADNKSDLTDEKPVFVQEEKAVQKLPYFREPNSIKINTRTDNVEKSQSYYEDNNQADSRSDIKAESIVTAHQTEKMNNNPDAISVSDKNPKDTNSILPNRADSVQNSTSAVASTSENKFISVNIGAIMMNSFSNQKTQNSHYVLNPAAGITIHFPLKDKFNLNIGLSYQQSRGNSLQRYSVHSRYFAYKETDSVFLLTQKIDFLNVNVDLQRQIWNKHFLFGGLMFTSVNNTSSIKTHVVMNPFFYNSETTQEKGFFEGITTISYGLSLGYNYHLTRNTWLGFRFQQSFNDLIDNKVYQFNRKDLITQFGVYMKIMFY